MGPKTTAIKVDMERRNTFAQDVGTGEHLAKSYLYEEPPER